MQLPGSVPLGIDKMYEVTTPSRALFVCNPPLA